MKHAPHLLIKLSCVLSAAILATPIQMPAPFGVATKQLATIASSRDADDPFADVPAIWPHNQQPLAHEVVLFRYTFTLETPISQARLAVFADTRYELWLDGLRLGRCADVIPKYVCGREVGGWCRKCR